MPSALDALCAVLVGQEGHACHTLRLLGQEGRADLRRALLRLLGMLEGEHAMAERRRYFVDLVAAHPLDLLVLGRNMEDLALKGYRLHSVLAHQDERRGACLLLFWERALAVSGDKDYG